MFPREKRDRQTDRQDRRKPRRVASETTVGFKPARRVVGREKRLESSHSSKKLATRTYLLTPPYYHL